ncbi:MAG TPA: nicotinate (nicotinamide) nucleotide adenylyltransferase [Myxococcota bacterium]|nr:nicotinate (nicotinamide) nucleotide adenylyltransferase [Myxococcota bacterium]
MPFSLPSAKHGARVGFFGGSFDPPHLGHMMLGLSFLSLELLDELWIVPCNDHAFKKTICAFHDRMAMCKLAFSQLQNTKVLDIEHHLPSPNYTINTIKAINAIRPDLTIIIGLGSDLIKSFDSWHQASSLASLAQFAIFAREHYPCDLPSMLNHARVHDGYILPDTSSTALRESLSLEPKEKCSLVDRRVQHYINEHNLYS